MFFKKFTILERKNNNSKPRIALLRGAVLEKRNIREMELLTDYFDIVAFGRPMKPEDKKTITLPIMELKIKEVDYPAPESNLFRPFKAHMIGLEKELKDYDLIFTGDSYYQMSYQAIEAKKKYRNRVVVLQNENIPFNFNKEGNNHIHKKVIENADHFIAIATPSKEALMIEGVSADKISVIPWGIDLNRFDNAREESKKTFIKKYNIPIDAVKILYVGRLDWSKGVFDIIYAAKKILMEEEIKNKKIAFIMIGNGPENEILKKQAQLLKIEEYIYFCGNIPLDEIEIPYLISDILLAPSIPTQSIREQFGQVLIEGMAAGLSIITTYTGAMPEVVGDSAILIPPSDYVSLSKELKKLILEPILRQKLSIKAKERVKEKYDIQKVALQIKDTLNMVLKG